MKLRKKVNQDEGHLIAESEDDVEALRRLYKAKTIRGAYRLWIVDGSPVIEDLINLLKAFPKALAVLSISNYKED